MNMLLRLLMYPVFHYHLKSKIIHNYNMRLIAARFKKSFDIEFPDKDGKYWCPDEVYWADMLAARFGYFVECKPERDVFINRANIILA